MATAALRSKAPKARCYLFTCSDPDIPQYKSFLKPLALIKFAKMASLEHSELRPDEDGEDDDEEGDSSSTTTNNSTTTSDDDDDSEDDETSSEDEELTRSVATPFASSSLAAMEASSPAVDDGVTQEEVVSPSMPAKKRIKLGFDLGSVKTEDTMDPDASRSKTVDTKLASDLSPPSSKLATAKATSFLTLSTSQDPDSVSSLLIKKKLKLPPHKAMMERASTEGTEGDSELVVKAMVVESDDGGEDDAVAAVVEKPIPVKSKSSSRAESVTSAASGTKQPRRQTNPTIKPVRFPPISSPGLLTTVPVGQYRETIDAATGLATPAAVFDHAMSLVGYTAEMRSKKPHRGSSVRRVVDDMFDSNVKFTLNFPRLIPEDLVPSGNEATPHDGPRLTDRLMKAFQPNKTHTQLVSTRTSGTEAGSNTNNGGTTKTSEKRRKRKIPGFNQLAPLSLTIPYPEEYIQRRLEYVEKLNAR